MCAQLTKNPTFGNIVALGSLYDAHKDRIISQSVFADLVPADANESVKVVSKSYRVNSSSLLADKFAQLELSPELGLSFLAGTSDLFATRGSAGYLLPRKSDPTAQEASVVYTETNRHETLSLSHEELPGIVDADALQTEGATHVIVGVWWGGRVAVTARRPSSASNMGGGSIEAEFPLSTVVDSIGQLFIGKPVGSDPELEEAAKNLNFQVNTDIDPDKKAAGVSSLGTVQDFITAFPAALKKVKMGKGTPIAYDLIPIKDFANAVSQQITDEPCMPIPVDERYQQQVVTLFDDLYTAKQVLNDYIDDLSQHELSVPKAYLSNTKQTVSSIADFEDSLRQSLSQDLSRARNETYTEVLRLSTSSWASKIAEYKNLAVPYAVKMAFQDEVTKLGIEYLQPVDLKALWDKHPDGDIYVLFYSDAATSTNVWQTYYREFMKLAASDESQKPIVAVVDCDFGPNESVTKPRIELRRNGKVVATDYVSEQEGLTGKCLMRPATNGELLHLPETMGDSIRREVKIPCPCSAEKIYECVCPTCKETIFFLVADGYLYCSCGRYRPDAAVLKCPLPSHGREYRKFKDPKELIGILNALKPFDQYNILILGETGVGKSTFINSFVNYMLFKNLDDALQAPGLNYAIPCSFPMPNMVNGVWLEREVRIGMQNDREQFSDKGQSATQSCVTYVFHMNGSTFRLIDTPGIGDTRGVDQDNINMANIVETLKSVDKLNTILFLMKPDSTRLTDTFNFCMTGLLSQLHKDTNKNIVFGFTRARSTKYELGATRTPLQALLDEKKTGIVLGYNNTFFFEAESFQYLAAFKEANIVLKNKKDYDESFAKSAEEARRLINGAIVMSTHEVRKTLALSSTREYIEGLKEPLIKINDIVTREEEDIKTQQTYVNTYGLSNDGLKDNLKRTVRIPERTELQEPQTVCTHENCRTNGADKTGTPFTIYKVCHQNCTVKTPTNEQVGLVELMDCAAFNCKGDPCVECTHSWQLHQHIRFRLQEKVVVEDNDEVLKIWNSNLSLAEKAKQVIANFTANIKMLQNRKEFITNALASFGVYLEQIAIVKFNDATTNYLDYRIKNAKANGKLADAKRYEDQQKAYNDQFNSMKGNELTNVPSNKPTESDIENIIAELNKMEINGVSVKSLLDQRKKDIPLVPHYAVTIRLLTAGKSSKLFSWIKRAKGSISS
ncbi:hypothetical protein LZL87_011456 [Fusarium oxysporum]|nr:hypothetical protein LZL87_011456 [Fusarium oxysporum]